MNERTPYERHVAAEHDSTRHSPNGVDTIEECERCGLAFLHQPDHEPVTLWSWMPRLREFRRQEREKYA